MTIHLSSEAGFTDIPASGLLELPAAKPLTGEIETWTRRLFSSTDGASSVGFWEVSAGTSYWDFTDYTEVVYVVEGELTVTEVGGDPVLLKEGDVGVFPVGWKGEWEVPSGLKKLYVVFPDATAGAGA